MSFLLVPRTHGEQNAIGERGEIRGQSAAAGLPGKASALSDWPKFCSYNDLTVIIPSRREFGKQGELYRLALAKSRLCWLQTQPNQSAIGPGDLAENCRDSRKIHADGRSCQCGAAGEELFRFV